MSSTATSGPEPGVDEDVAKTRRLVELARLAAAAYGRPDLEERQRTALERIDRPGSVICVIGEFKQGKSSLVNALIGSDVAPVNDDLSTATLTFFAHGDVPEAAVTWDEEGGERREVVALDAYSQFISEETNPQNRRRVGRVEVAVPSPFLSAGVTLVDTPGFGGLALGYGGMTLAYLRGVDAVVFVSDAAGPLTQPEIDFLKHAVEACPAVMMALTKVDLYPEWRRIQAIDEELLARGDLDVPAMPVSSLLMARAQQPGNADLAELSGVPGLAEILSTLVVDEARVEACARGLGESRATISHLRASAAAELAAAEDPAASAARQAELEAFRKRLEHLRGPGSRWSQVLSDGLSDVVNEADHRFRAETRAIGRQMDEELERVDPGREWDRLRGSVREQVGASTDRMLRDLEEGGREVERRIIELLRDEDGVELSTLPGSAGAFDASALWTERDREKRSVTAWADTAYSGVRGGQGGITTISIVAGLAGVTISTAATAGIGLLFSGKQLFDERKRQLQQRRQQARSSIRQYIDDVQFEAGKHMRDLSRDIQRRLRDHFSQRIQELQRTCTEAGSAAQEAAKQEASKRASLAAELRDRIAQFDQIAEALETHEATL